MQKKSIWISLFLLPVIVVIIYTGYRLKSIDNSPSLLIIPVNALDKEIPDSTSRFVAFKDNGRFMSKGSVGMILKPGSSMMVSNAYPDYWGLGGEHAFQDDYPGWGNGQFSADITTDPSFPLTFKVTEKGYAYLCGKGIIRIKDGKEYKLGYNIDKKGWIAGIGSKHQLVREGSCEAAARLGLTDAVPNLIKALEDPAWEVRRNACEALGLLGDNRVVSSLENAEKDKEKRVSDAAAQALKQIQDSELKNKKQGYMFRTTTS
jgi:hypothetical protein